MLTKLQKPIINSIYTIKPTNVCELYLSRYSLPICFNRCHGHHQGNLHDENDSCTVYNINDTKLYNKNIRPLVIL